MSQDDPTPIEQIRELLEGTEDQPAEQQLEALTQAQAKLVEILDAANDQAGR